MRLAIMQPYLFPYQGYFQLISCVDRFVLYDDVAFIKNGWINRNRILTANGVSYFTVPLSGASSSRRILDTQCAPASTWAAKMLRTMEQAYAKAPFRKVGMELLAAVFEQPNCNSIRDLAVASIKAVCSYADIDVTFVESSTRYDNAHLAGAARVLDICNKECASQYVNAPGGRSLYDLDMFRLHGVDLKFSVPQLLPYPQSRTSEFVAGLSVIDLIMSVEQPAVAERLGHGSVSP